MILDDPTIKNSFLRDAFSIGVGEWEPTCDFLVLDWDTILSLADKLGVSVDVILKVVLAHEELHRLYFTSSIEDILDWTTYNCTFVTCYNKFKKIQFKTTKKAILLFAISAKKLRLEINPLMEALCLYGAEHFQFESRNFLFDTLEKKILEKNPEAEEFYEDLNSICKTCEDDKLPGHILILALNYPKVEFRKYPFFRFIPFAFKIPQLLSPQQRFRDFSVAFKVMDQEGISFCELASEKKANKIYNLYFANFLKRELWNELVALSIIHTRQSSKKTAIKKTSHNRDFIKKAESGKNVNRGSKRANPPIPFLNVFTRGYTCPRSTLPFTLIGFKDEGKIKLGGRPGTSIAEYHCLRRHLNLCGLTYDVVHSIKPSCFLEKCGKCLTNCASCFQYSDLKNARKIAAIFNSVEIPEIENIWNKIKNR